MSKVLLNENILIDIGNYISTHSQGRNLKPIEFKNYINKFVSTIGCNVSESDMIEGTELYSESGKKVGTLKKYETISSNSFEEEETMFYINTDEIVIDTKNVCLTIEYDVLSDFLGITPDKIKKDYTILNIVGTNTKTSESGIEISGTYDTSYSRSFLTAGDSNVYITVNHNCGFIPKEITINFNGSCAIHESGNQTKTYYLASYATIDDLYINTTMIESLPYETYTSGYYGGSNRSLVHFYFNEITDTYFTIQVYGDVYPSTFKCGWSIPSFTWTCKQ